MRLAYEIVKSCTDEKSAIAAENAFVATFQQRESTDVSTEVTGNARSLEDILLSEGFVESKSALRRLLDAGAISNFDTKEKVFDAKLPAALATYKVGKNRFIKII